MAQTPPPSITPTPTPAPQRGDRATFSARVDAFIMWLTTAVGQFAAVATNVYNNAVDAFNNATSALQSANIAKTQANAAQAAAGVLVFSPTKNYAAGDVVYSPINSQSYRRLSAGTNATDPSNDQTNWRLLSGNDINGAFVPVTLNGTVIDLSLGNYFIDSTGANKAYTFTNVPAAGSSFTFELTTTATILASFPASVKSPSNIGPSFQANKRHKLMFVSSNGGTRFDLSYITNYDI